MKNLEGKNALATLKDCEEVWTIRAAELFRIYLNQVPSSRKKTACLIQKNSKLDSTIRFCNRQN